MNVKWQYGLFTGTLLAAIAILTFLLFRESLLYLFLAEIVILGFVMTAFRLSARIFRPMDQIKTGSEALKHHDFTHKMRYTDSPEMNAMVTVYNNIIENIRKERVFQQEQHFFLRSLIDALPVGILILDYDDRLSEFNPEAEKMLSLSPENIGMSLHDINPRLEQALLKIRTKGHFRFRDSPHRYYRGLINHFMHRGFARKFVILEDVSSEILRIEKESYGKVIRMMTHEVNNSVGAINSILTSLLTSSDMDETEFREYLGIILERNKSLNQFMHNFAKVVRIPPPRPAEASLNKLLKNVFQLMKSGSSDKDLTFQLSLPENEVTAAIDGDQMEQVLINIFLNAMEAIEGSGTIIAELQEDPTSIRIIDTGIGISPEVAERIFTPFFSTKPTGQGVGLTMIREILNNHGLDYSLRSADGRTVFKIRFERVGTIERFRK